MPLPTTTGLGSAARDRGRSADRRSADSASAGTALLLVALLGGAAPVAAAGERILYATDFASDLGGMSAATICDAATAWHRDTACAGGGDPPPSPPGYARWGVPGNCGTYASSGSRTRLSRYLLATAECVWDLELSFAYLVDLQEGSRYDRARVWLGYSAADKIEIFSTGFDAQQEAACAGGVNSSEPHFTLISDGSWHSEVARLSWLHLGSIGYFSALAYDFFDLVFEAETTDGAANLGRGFLIDDVLVSCTPRGPGSTALLATFDADPPASPPGPIETGTLQVTPGTWPLEVVEFAAGDPELMVEDFSVISSPVVAFVPSSEPVEALVEYVYTLDFMDTGETYAHGPATWPDLDGPKLLWRKTTPTSGEVWLSTTDLLTIDDVFLDTYWFAGERAKIVWVLSGARDRFSVWYNDYPAALDRPFPHERIESVRFYGTAGAGQTGAYLVDDVRVTEFAPIFADGFESGDTSAWSNG